MGAPREHGLGLSQGGSETQKVEQVKAVGSLYSLQQVSLEGRPAECISVIATTTVLPVFLCFILPFYYLFSPLNNELKLSPDF